MLDTPFLRGYYNIVWSCVQGQCALNVLYIFTTVIIAAVLYNRPHWPSFLCVWLECFIFDIAIEPWPLAKSLMYRAWLHCILPWTKQGGEYHSSSWEKGIMDLSFSALLKSINSPQNPPACPSVSPSPPTLEYCILQAKLTVPAPSLLLNTLSFLVSAFQCLSP